MSTVFLDTNVLIGTMNPNDALHKMCVTALYAWEREDAVFAMSVVA